MNQVTRCPECETTFRVSLAQLSARGGRVRCGKCSAVFDGVAHLVPEEAVKTPLEVPEQPFEPVAGSEPEETVLDVTGETEPMPSATGHPEGESELPQSSGPVAISDSSLPAQIEPPLAKRKIVVPAFLARQSSPVVRTLAWVVLSGSAVACLALQAALHFRTELAVLVPSARTYLEAACTALGCEVRLPRRADLMSIESSDLQADSQRTGVIVLNALLRNRAPFAQEYPDLELTLTDQGDRPVIRRVLAAGEYLQEKRSAVGQGLTGGAEETVRIYLDTGGIAATGYQLFLFYSCPVSPPSAFWQLSYPSRCHDARNK